MVWNATDPEGNEAGKIKWDIVPYTRGRGLDLGCGPYKAFGHFTGVDNGDHIRQFGWQYKPDVIVDTCERLDLFADRSMDFVFSAHLLEHIEAFEDALREWWRVIKTGGYLVLYLPHKDLYPNIGQPGANPDHKHDFVPQDISDAMYRVAAGSSGWDLIENEVRSAGREYSFYQVYRKRNDGQCQVAQNRWKHPGKPTVCVVRYGGFGDMIQTSSVLPFLKATGYHVTVMTTPRGKSILEHDPHIDGWVIQDSDQVPNGELGNYWAAWKKKFDRFINLSESVEVSLLATPGHSNHGWPDTLRRKMLGVNYLDFMHAIAEVPGRHQPAFYPTEDEQAWARAEVPEGFVIMWALAGSSVHKAYPHMENVLAAVMLNMPEAKVILVGDESGQVLEFGWENEPRVLCRSGKWKIRQTLAVALQCDLVIGPETGVLNAVSYCEDVAKIVFLSHSSVENLTRGWPNTTSLTADVPCYPCHRMHYDRTHCPEAKVPVETHPIAQDPKLLKEMTEAGHVQDGQFLTGAALCAAAITPESVCASIRQYYETWSARRTVPATG